MGIPGVEDTGFVYKLFSDFTPLRIAVDLQAWVQGVAGVARYTACDGCKIYLYQTSAVVLHDAFPFFRTPMNVPWFCIAAELVVPFMCRLSGRLAGVSQQYRAFHAPSNAPLIALQPTPAQGAIIAARCASATVPTPANLLASSAASIAPNGGTAFCAVFSAICAA